MEWFLFITIIFLAWFWWDSLGSRQIAVNEAARLCQQANVSFLDDSVALARLRLCRSQSGSMSFKRRFMFEFCTDGRQRYGGYVDMQGKVIQQTHMDAYRLIDSP